MLSFPKAGAKVLLFFHIRKFFSKKIRIFAKFFDF